MAKSKVDLSTQESQVLIDSILPQFKKIDEERSRLLSILTKLGYSHGAQPFDEPVKQKPFFLTNVDVNSAQAGYNVKMTWLAKILFFIKRDGAMTSPAMVKTIMETEGMDASQRGFVMRSVSSTMGANSKGEDASLKREKNENDEWVYSIK